MFAFKTKCSWVAAIVMTAAWPAASLEAQTLLRYQFKEGEKLNYEMTQKMSMQMDIQGQQIKVDMTQILNLSWSTTSVMKNGDAQMLQKFERVRMTMDGNGGKFEYDSKDGTLPGGAIGQMVGPLLEAMVGAEFPLTMDTRGKVTNVKIPQKFTDALKKQPAAAGAGEMFTEEGIKRMITAANLQFPADAVSKGKSWDVTVEMKMPFGKMKVVNDWSYEGPATDKGLEKFTTKANVTLDPDPNAPVQAKLKSNDTTGTAYFNNSTGRLTESNVTQTMEMELSANGMSFVQKLEQSIILKLEDKSK